MLPSPSLGPPWLSLSPSPALGPCGIPEELDPPALDVPALDPPALELVEVAAGACDALEDFDEDEPPPQPATAMPATASMSAIPRRAEIKLIVISFTFLW